MLILIAKQIQKYSGFWVDFRKRFFESNWFYVYYFNWKKLTIFQ